MAQATSGKGPPGRLSRSRDRRISAHPRTFGQPTQHHRGGKMAMAGPTGFRPDQALSSSTDHHRGPRSPSHHLCRKRFAALDRYQRPAGRTASWGSMGPEGWCRRSLQLDGVSATTALGKKLSADRLSSSVVLSEPDDAVPAPLHSIRISVQDLVLPKAALRPFSEEIAGLDIQGRLFGWDQRQMEPFCPRPLARSWRPAGDRHLEPSVGQSCRQRFGAAGARSGAAPGKVSSMPGGAVCPRPSTALPLPRY